MRRPLSWLSWSAFAAVFAVAAITQADPDLWGHVRFGLDLLRTHALPSVDPYSFTQDLPWINHEWLSELMMGAAYDALGVSGLSLLKGALVTTTVLLVWTAYRGAAFEARVSAAAFASLGLLTLARTLRPQLWSVACLALLIRVLMRPSRDRRWWLPCLFAVWANVHGGWIVGLGVLLAWLEGERLQGTWPARRALALGAGCVLATLVTPYGWTLWRFMIDTIHATRPNIEEWAPLWSFGPSQWLMPLLACVAILWLGLRRDGLARLAVLLILAVCGIRVARVAPLFVEAAVLLLAPIVVSRWPVRTFEIRTRAERLLVFGMSYVMAFGAGAILAVFLRCISVDPATRPDPVVVSALRQAAPGRLVLFFNWGEYAIWQFGPAIRVSMDGRRETVYSDRRLAEHDAILAGAPQGLEALDLWRPEYVWLPASSTATRSWLAAHGYRLDVETPQSYLAVRADISRVTAISGAGSSACFPQ